MNLSKLTRWPDDRLWTKRTEEQHNLDSRCRVNVERMQHDCRSLLQELRQELQKLLSLDAHSLDFAPSRCMTDSEHDNTSALTKPAAVDTPQVPASLQTGPVIVTIEDVYPSPPRSLVEEMTEGITTEHATVDNISYCHWMHRPVQDLEYLECISTQPAAADDQQPPSAAVNASAGMIYSQELPSSPSHQGCPVPEPANELDIWQREQMAIRMTMQSTFL